MKIKKSTAVQENMSKIYKKLSKFSLLSYLFVIIPTTVAIIYFGVIASDVYTSESSYIVKTPKTQASLSGVGAFFSSMGISRSNDDTFALNAYLTSRTMLNELKKDVDVITLYTEKGDLFSRFNSFIGPVSNEKFYQFFKNKINISFDSSTGISKLQVDGFSAEDAYLINNKLLELGELFINRINLRAKEDILMSANKELADAESYSQQSTNNLNKFKSTYKIIDLQQESMTKLDFISGLQKELNLLQAQIEKIKTLSPENPQIKTLELQEKILIENIENQMAGITGQDELSIANIQVEYQQLLLTSNIANKQLATSLSALDDAKREIYKKQLYLGRIESPSMPDEALKPTRLYNIISIFIIGLILFGIMKLLTASIREHHD